MAFGIGFDLDFNIPSLKLPDEILKTTPKKLLLPRGTRTNINGRAGVQRGLLRNG